MSAAARALHPRSSAPRPPPAAPGPSPPRSAAQPEPRAVLRGAHRAAAVRPRGGGTKSPPTGGGPSCRPDPKRGPQAGTPGGSCWGPKGGATAEGRPRARGVPPVARAGPAGTPPASASRSPPPHYLARALLVTVAAADGLPGGAARKPIRGGQRRPAQVKRSPGPDGARTRPGSREDVGFQLDEILHFSLTLRFRSASRPARALPPLRGGGARRRRAALWEL